MISASSWRAVAMMTGVVVTAALVVVLWAGVWRMFATGYKLKT